MDDFSKPFRNTTFCFHLSIKRKQKNIKQKMETSYFLYQILPIDIEFEMQSQHIGRLAAQQHTV